MTKPEPANTATDAPQVVPAVGALLERGVGRLEPERADAEGRTYAERQYLRTLRELQELAKNAPYVSQEWVRDVACMDEMDMRRRLIRSNDWHGHFAHSLDGIPEIRNLPGSGIDGCRSHKEVRAVVLELLRQIERLKTPNVLDTGALGRPVV